MKPVSQASQTHRNLWHRMWRRAAGGAGGGGPAWAWAGVRGLVGAAWLACAAGAAWGQVNTLDPALVRSPTLTGEAAGRVDAYAAALLSDLGGDDADRAERAKDSLVGALGDPLVSVAFRQAMSERVVPLMAERFAASEASVEVRLTALRLAGELATDRSVALIRGAMDDPAEEIRYFAVFACELVFNELRTAQPAVSDARAADLVDALAARLGQATDPRHADVAGRALAEAVSVPREAIAGLSDRALRALVIGFASRVRAAPGDTPAPMSDAEWRELLGVVRAAEVAQTEVAVPRSDLPAETSREIVGFGADIVAFVLDRVEGGEIDAADLPRLVLLTRVAEAMIEYGAQRMNDAGSPVEAPRVGELAALLEGGKVREFRTEGLSLVSRFESAPWSFGAERFGRVRG